MPALEVLAFRSLFRNHRVELLADKEKVNYIADKMLWAAAMAFHWAMFIVILRHFRFFVEPVPQRTLRPQLIKQGLRLVQQIARDFRPFE